MAQNKDTQFFMVDADVVSPTLSKVLEAKRLLKTKSATSVSDAVKRVGISRSAFYKYKDSVFPLYEHSRGKNITFSFDLDDAAGILSEVLSLISAQKANILTLNQSLPINGVANIVVTVETDEMEATAKDLVSQLGKKQGLWNLRILARE